MSVSKHIRIYINTQRAKRQKSQYEAERKGRDKIQKLVDAADEKRRERAQVPPVDPVFVGVWVCGCVKVYMYTYVYVTYVLRCTCVCKSLMCNRRESDMKPTRV